ncbi:mannitol dehydrogenase family protein [Marinomonas epiphytica]
MRLKNAKKEQEIVETQYPRESLQTKIVHLGFGAFHRAHQGVYTDLANQESQSDWGIYGINLFRKGPLSEEFAAQNNLMSLIERSQQGSTNRVIRCFTGAMNISDQGIKAALAKLCEPQVAIVSLTITEKGYCLSPNGQLNLENDLIKADLKHPREPISAIGIICEALRIRKVQGLSPFSVLSCDNIPENGVKTKSALIQFANQLDAELAHWVESQVSFPSTMVDRIVPAMDEQSFQSIADTFGKKDPFGLISESFKQWVIEDQFCAGRPAWELAGASLVKDVVPYEEMKLRMLNGSHSFLAYVGSLCGHEYIYQCMQDSELKAITFQLMTQEQASSLDPQLDVDLQIYAKSLIERFSNPHILHKTSQIAMDGSQKLPPRVIDTILSLESSPNNTFVPRKLLFLLAAWMHFIQGKNSESFVLEDPEDVTLNTLIAQNEADICSSLLSFSAVFRDQFLIKSDLISLLKDYYQTIEQQGIRYALTRLNHEEEAK